MLIPKDAKNEKKVPKQADIITSTTIKKSK